MTNSLMIASFVPTWLVFLSACISPGPNTFMVMSVALNSGKSSALLVTLGLAIGGFIWPLISLLGVSQLLARNPQFIKWIALVGGSYLLYLGFKSLLSVVNNCRQGLATSERQVVNRVELEGISAIRRGLLTTLSNPKVAMVWISLSSVIPVASDRVGWIIVYSAVIGVIVFSVYTTIACIFSNALAQTAYMKKANWINGLFSALFIILGGFILANEFG
jgi:threonine efflux protein